MKMIEGLSYCIEAFGSTDPVANNLLHRPGLTKVILSPTKKSAIVLTNFVEKSVFFMSNDVADAKEFAKAFDFTKECDPQNNKLIVASLKDDVLPVFDEVKTTWPGIFFDCPCHVYTIDPEQGKKIDQPTEFTLKDGSIARIRDITEEDAVFVNKNWAYGHGEVEWMLRGIIKKTSAGAIIEVNGEPACWGLQ